MLSVTIEFTSSLKIFLVLISGRTLIYFICLRVGIVIAGNVIKMKIF